jgi:uncharacterized phage protein gp47/JayE
MANPSIDETGFSPASFDEILTSYTIDLIAAFGENVRTEAQTVFGIWMRLFGLSVEEQNELAEFLLQSFDPQSATNVQLSKLVLLAGIQRTEDAKSTVVITCTANANGATIPAGSLVSDPNGGIQWQTDEQVVVAPSSTNTVSATAVEAGPTEAAAGTITRIDSPAFGWTTVTNLAAANVGRTEETDSALRLRFQSAVSSASKVSNGARFAAVSDLDGVESVVAISNNTSTTDANGVPPHHVFTVVDGGTNSEIAAAIYDHTAGGIGYHGNTSASHTDPVSGDVYDIKYERPTDDDVYVTITLTTDDNYPSDGDSQIKTAVADYINSLDIGDDVLHSRLYTPVNTVPGHTVDSMFIAFHATPILDDDLIVPINKRAVTDTTKIIVNS